MTTPYNFTLTLRPYGDAPDRGVVAIDGEAKYGYWERPNGTEGGGLWFDESDGQMYLTDHDGAGELPRRVITALREAGIQVEQA